MESSDSLETSASPDKWVYPITHPQTSTSSIIPHHRFNKQLHSHRLDSPQREITRQVKQEKIDRENNYPNAILNNRYEAFTKPLDHSPPLLSKQDERLDHKYLHQSMPPIQSTQYVSNGYHSDYNSDDSMDQIDQRGHREEPCSESPLDFSVRRNNGVNSSLYDGRRDNGTPRGHGRDSVSSTAGSDKDVASPESAITNGILSPNGNDPTRWPTTHGLGQGRQTIPGTSSHAPVSPTLPLPGMMNPASLLAAAGTFPFLMDPRQLQQMQLQKQTEIKSEDGKTTSSSFKGLSADNMSGISPLRFFGLPGILPGMMPGLDVASMQGMGLGHEDMLSQYRMYISKAQETMKQQEKLTQQRKSHIRSSSESEYGNSPSSTTGSVPSHSISSTTENTGHITASPTSTTPNSNIILSPGSLAGGQSSPTTPLLMPSTMTSIAPTLTPKMPPTQQRRRPRQHPEENKDMTYWDRRRKNNAAAKRSRDVRRAKEDEIAIRAAFLEQENLKLRVEVAALKNETSKLRCMLYNS